MGVTSETADLGTVLGFKSLCRQVFSDPETANEWLRGRGLVASELANLSADVIRAAEAELRRIAESDAPEIKSPLDGMLVAVDDPDGLIDLYEQLDLFDKHLYATKLKIREALAALTEGDAKTRRVMGKRRAAKVTMPADSWDNGILREAWESYPALRDGYLRIAKIEPRLREVKKLANTSGTPEIETFRNMVLSANRGPTGTPSISIER